MPEHNEPDRLDAEWVSVSAIREMLHLVHDGNSASSTYAKALSLGEDVVPALLGRDVSLLQRESISHTAREYRQRAEMQTRRSGEEVSPTDLLESDVDEDNRLLENAHNQRETSEIRRRQRLRMRALQELTPIPQSENQTINRDFFTAVRDVPEIDVGPQYRDFGLSDGAVLRTRITHPDPAEGIVGSDLIYERHIPARRSASVVGIQYKIWNDKALPLGESRMKSQLSRLQKFFCSRELCVAGESDHTYRFPHCSAFLRPTDKLQSPDQRLRSSGEHIPICRIEDVAETGPKGGKSLRYDSMKDVSLRCGAFEYLFSSGKLGSRTLSYDELAELYAELGSLFEKDHLVIHAQDFRGSFARDESGEPV